MPVAVLLLLPFPEVDAPCQLADDGEVDPAADMLFERRDGGQGVGGEIAGAQVAEGGEFFAELEEALFWADGAGAVFLLQRIMSGVLFGRNAVEGTGGSGEPGHLLRLRGPRLPFWLRRGLRR